VTNIEDALPAGKAYLLAKQFHRAQVSSQQITTRPEHPAQEVAANTTPSLVEVDRLITVEQLVAALACVNLTESTRGPLRPGIEVPRLAALCWGCGTPGHLRLSCPQSGKPLNFYGPQTLPNPAGLK